MEGDADVVHALVVHRDVDEKRRQRLDLGGVCGPAGRERAQALDVLGERGDGVDGVAVVAVGDRSREATTPQELMEAVSAITAPE